MEKVEIINGVEFIFKTLSLEKFYEIKEEFEKTGNKVLFEKKIIFNTIKSWNRKDENGNPIPLTFKTLFEFLTLAGYKKIDQIVAEVNNLSELEKKT